MSTPNPSKKERRDAARAEREAAEQAAGAAVARKKRLGILGGIVAGAAVLIVAIVLISGGGDDKGGTPDPSGSTVAGVAESTAMLKGVPQSGNTLGNPNAPVTMLEFADLQCPYCKDYTLQTLPQVVQDYVRAGKVKIELHLLTFLGPDSIRGADVAKAAADQNRLFNFADLFYYNQGQEQTGYATDDFLKKIAGAVPALDTAKVFADPVSTTPSATDQAADALAAKYGVSGTPSFVIGPTGGALKLIDGFDYASIKTAIDGALAKGT